MFLKSIGNFRGLAIIIIVAGHLFDFGLLGEDAISSVVRNIITGGTALFVFISGFMFHYVFYKRYEYKKFMINKVRNVGVPYFLLSSLIIGMLFVKSVWYFEPAELLSSAQYASLYPDGVIFSPGDSNILTILKFYISGRFLTAYWYIPFVLLLFATAPMHFKFVNFKLSNQVLIISLLSVIAIFIHRPIANTNPLHSLVYYTPMYLIGILVSIHADSVKKFLNNKIPVLLCFVLVMSFIEYSLGHDGNYHKPFFEYAGVDLQYLQKIGLIFLFYILFERYTFESKLLDTISNTSFAIFFIHPWILMIIYKINDKYNLVPIEKTDNVALYLVSLVCVVTLSVSIALLTKKVFSDSKNTRYLIGY